MIEILPYVAAAIAAIGALVVAYSKGKSAEQNKQRDRNQASMNDAKKVQHEIDSLDDDSVRARASKWVRNKER